MKSLAPFISFLILILSFQSGASICPDGWVNIEQADGRQQFCIELQKQNQVKTYEASLICEAKNAKVCTSDQWVAACQRGRISSQGWEWAISLNQYLSIVGNTDCMDLAFGELAPAASLRCCK